MLIKTDWSEVLKASSDPVYFAESKYFCNVKLRPMQAEIIRDFYSQNWTDELVLCCGMRGGKTIIGIMMGLYEAFKLLVTHPSPQEKYGLIPSTPIFLMLLAYSEPQAIDIIYKPLRGIIDNSEFFQIFNPRPYKLELQFPSSNIVIKCGGINSPGLMGKTVKFEHFSEVGRFEKEHGKAAAKYLYETIKGSTANFGQEGIKVSESAPVSEDDLIYSQVPSAPGDYGRFENKGKIVWYLPTWQMDPSITRESLQPQFDKDPIGALRNFAAIPTGGLSPFFPNPQILKTDPNTTNLLALHSEGVSFTSTEFTHVLAGDPAKKGTSFGLSMGYLDKDGVMVIDGLWKFEAKPDISPSYVRNFVLTLLDKVPISHYTFDIYMYTELEEELKNRGVITEQHHVNRKDYDDLKDAMYAQKIKLCGYPYIIKELKELQIGKSGKVMTNNLKDVADSLANCVRLLNNTIPVPVVSHYVSTF